MKNKSTKRLLILIGLFSLATLLMVFYPIKQVKESIYVLEGEVPEVFQLNPENDSISVKLISDNINVLPGEVIKVQVLVEEVSSQLEVHGFNFQIDFDEGINLVNDSVNIPYGEFFKGNVSNTDDTNVLVYFVSNKDSFLTLQNGDELLNFEVKISNDASDGQYVVSFNPNFEQFVGDAEFNILTVAADLVLNVGTTITKIESPAISPYVPTTYDSQIKITGKKEDGIGIKVDGKIVVAEESRSTTWEVTLPLAIDANSFVITAFKGEDSSTPITVSINRHMVADINGKDGINSGDLGILGGQYYIFQTEYAAKDKKITDNDINDLRLSDMNRVSKDTAVLEYGDGFINYEDLGVFGKEYYEYNKKQ